MLYRAAGERLPWHGTQSLLKIGARSCVYATLAGVVGAGVVGEPGGVGEAGGDGEGVVVAVVFVVAALDGPSGTPLEQPTAIPSGSSATAVRLANRFVIPMIFIGSGS